MSPSILATGIALAGALSTVRGSPISERAAANCSAGAIPYPVVFGATITSLTAEAIDNYLIPGNNVCQVNVTLTHPGTGDVVNNQVLLPLTTWNGIFQGVGGGGFSAGFFQSLIPIAYEGYACASTDGGHTMDPLEAEDASTWALVSEGNVNQYALLDFAYRSYHDMTVIGKAVTESFYGTAAKYSYWNGCSTGGRQGMVEAQRYPTDYDGILAEAPAIQWNDFTPAQQWPFVVLNNEGYAPLQCEFTAINAATIAACDGLDGLLDGVISAPALCDFSPESLVGKSFFCASNNKTMTFSAKTAEIVEKIWAGPRTPAGEFLWYGITKGTNFSTLADTTVAANGSSIAVAFPISDSWYRDFLFKDINYDSANITYAEFTQLFHQGHMEYDSTLGTMDADLSQFKKAGGKMISWQGLADNLINPQGNMLYYEKVAALDPSVHDFYRQFYSPGVGHCGGGIGVTPVNAIGTLRAWVENGTAPVTLAASSEYPINASSAYVTNGTAARTQDLCAYPKVSKYDGKGDPALASSYSCAADMGWEAFAGPSGTNYSCAGGWY